MAPEDAMNTACWVVVEGEPRLLHLQNDPLYYMIVVYVGIKSTFNMTMYNQKL